MNRVPLPDCHYVSFCNEDGVTVYKQKLDQPIRDGEQYRVHGTYGGIRTIQIDPIQPAGDETNPVVPPDNQAKEQTTHE